MELPSALELESLSDSELIDRITAVKTLITENQSSYGDESDEQRLYRALETDLARRTATRVTRAAADAAAE